MKACVCRNISDKDYSTEEALRERIMQEDACCCKCQEHYNKARQARERKKNKSSK